METKLELRVRDWATDFTPGASILGEIERSSSRCTCGVLLFTNDDPLEGQERVAAPRDNVVFEAGYFMNARGRDRVVIIREKGAKMPADLGDGIYLELADRAKIASITSDLGRFLMERL